MTARQKGAYGAGNGLVDYILGITYEIWEQGGVELINQYYAEDTIVYGLDGVTRGAAEMIKGTDAMLAAYPDRLLIADDVIWSGSRDEGYYSSHRIISPMTNEGATLFGPATGKKVRILTIADCVVQEGVITLEWLIRDNHALVTQLGHDPVDCAKIIAARRNDESNEWIAMEIDRLRSAGVPAHLEHLVDPASATAKFALQAIANNWSHGDANSTALAYAPYAVQHRSPIELYSGRDSIANHFATLRGGISVAGLSVDHIAAQPADSEGMHIAARWCLAGTHTGNYLGLAATGRPVYVLGCSHWRIEAGKIALEWTVFDGLGVLSQLV
jgi:predicted ester cyclase